MTFRLPLPHRRGRNAAGRDAGTAETPRRAARPGDRPRDERPERTPEELRRERDELITEHIHTMDPPYPAGYLPLPRHYED